MKISEFTAPYRSVCTRTRGELALVVMSVRPSTIRTMSASEFDSAYAKLDRAREHQKTLAEIWNEYLDLSPFDFSLIDNGPKRWVLRASQSEPLPERMSVVFGEWLFNLRSALDSLTWATAVHMSRSDPPPKESALQYPIYDTEEQWKRNLYRLKPLADHQRDMLYMMQPFNTEDPDANFLGWINRLARIDRHRRMTIATARVAELEPVVECLKSDPPTLEWGERQFQDGYCDLIRLTFQNSGGHTPKANPRAGIDPEIAEWGDSPWWSRKRFSERLHIMELFVRAEVAIYEYDCTGGTRDFNPTTEAFRAESDRRRALSACTPITRPSRPEVAWAKATGRKSSTVSKFLGEDFPSHGPGEVRPR